MPEPSSDRDTARAGTPRWVKGFVIAGAVLLVLIVVMLLSGHGPGRHMHHGMSGQVPAAGGAGW
jgi:hypothetical protein